MKKYWILVAMLGTCLLWSAKTWGVEDFSMRPDYIGGYRGELFGSNGIQDFRIRPNYIGGYRGEISGSNGIQDFSMRPDYIGGYRGEISGSNGIQDFRIRPNYIGGYRGEVDGMSFSSHPDYAGGQFGQVDGGYSGYSGYGGYKSNRIGGNGIEHSFIPMATAPMAGQPVGGNEIENFSSTGNKPIGGRIMTTPNSKMTNDWLDFDNQLDRDSLTQLEKVVKIRKIEQINREMAEDLAHRQAQINYELAEQKRKEGIRQRYAEIHAKQAELPIPAKGTITGIAYSENSASALLNSEIIHEGDTIYGATVVKINKDNVEFEKNSNRWTQRIKETPAPYWE